MNEKKDSVFFPTFFFIEKDQTQFLSMFVVVLVAIEIVVVGMKTVVEQIERVVEGIVVEGLLGSEKLFRFL